MTLEASSPVSTLLDRQSLKTGPRAAGRHERQTVKPATGPLGSVSWPLNICWKRSVGEEELCQSLRGLWCSEPTYRSDTQAAKENMSGAWCKGGWHPRPADRQFDNSPQWNVLFAFFGARCIITVAGGLQKRLAVGSATAIWPSIVTLMVYRPPSRRHPRRLSTMGLCQCLSLGGKKSALLVSIVRLCAATRDTGSLQTL
jgi:hypothetical protein